MNPYAVCCPEYIYYYRSYNFINNLISKLNEAPDENEEEDINMENMRGHKKKSKKPKYRTDLLMLIQLINSFSPWILETKEFNYIINAASKKNLKTVIDSILEGTPPVCHHWVDMYPCILYGDCPDYH